MIAITTKYKGPTNTKGSKIVATAAKGQTFSLPYPHEISGEENRHLAAARALCFKMGWRGTLVSGGLENGYVFVFLPATISATVRRKVDELEARTDRSASEDDDLFILKTSAYVV